MLKFINILILLLGTISIVPSGLKINELLFISIFFITVYFSILKLLLLKSSCKSRIAVTIFFSFLFLILNLLVSLKNKVTIIEWIRGAIPFTSLLISIVFATVKLEKLDIDNIFSSIIFAALMKSIYTLYIGVNGGFFSNFYIGRRITFLTLEALNPLIIIGAFLSIQRILSSKKKVIKITYILVFIIFSLVIAFTFSRALLMLYIIGIVCSLKNIKSNKCSVIAILLILGIFGVRNHKFMINMIETFRLRIMISGLNGREIEFALVKDHINKDFLFGNGLGFKFNNLHGDNKLVAYTHNSLVYFFITTGLIGLIFYYGVLINTVTKLFKGKKYSSEFYNMLVVTLILLIYGLTFATFRSISYNIILGIIIGIVFFSDFLDSHPSLKRVPC